jgi:hypothetical protein
MSNQGRIGRRKANHVLQARRIGTTRCLDGQLPMRKNQSNATYRSVKPRGDIIAQSGHDRVFEKLAKQSQARLSKDVTTLRWWETHTPVGKKSVMARAPLF